MKLNIQVDIDWLEEDGNIDETVKEEIIYGVKNAISKQCLEKVEKKASTEIDKAIEASINSAQKKIEDKAVEFAESWLENEVTITDKWGDKADCLTIKDLIKRTFDNLLEKKVNDRGQFVTGYQDGVRLIDYLTGSRVQQVVDEHLKGINKEIEQSIKAHVESGIRKNVSDKFAEMVVQTAKHENQNKQIESK